MTWHLDKTADGRPALIVEYSSLNDWTEQISTALASLGLRQNQVAVIICEPTTGRRAEGMNQSEHNQRKWVWMDTR